ncbi:Serine protease family S10 [Phytophthora cinnamomi]|uniref:Serine protease family S10 n=1 Tax=Phytophthora cinnamomi TaxID=4785 RepID=UPI00355A837B|nr:Serine protease family S10 [Phytophthora cinnamomi]
MIITGYAGHYIPAAVHKIHRAAKVSFQCSGRSSCTLVSMAHDGEKTRLLPAVQAIYGSTSNKLKIKRCLIILGIVTTVILSGLSVWRLFFDDHDDESAAVPADAFICGDTKNEAGYIKLANKKDDNYFYWFFEAKHNASTAPLVIWLTGGPGGSSLLALFNENGPCLIQPDLTTKVHPYSWTYEANMIWLDQPSGVGFSYSSGGDRDYNENDVGENLFWFLQGFLERHPEFDGREFFLTGESYAGHYLPAAAHHIWEQSRRNDSEEKKINLQGIAIGNGWTDPIIQYSHSADMLDNPYNITLLHEEAAQQLKIDTVECLEKARDCQQNPTDAVCDESAPFCFDHLVGPFSEKITGRNPYDIREHCDWVEYGFCHGVPLIEGFLKQDVVRKYLNVDRDWVGGSEDVDADFTVDFLQSFSGNVADLLNDGVRVLLYVGDADLMCNWFGNKAWIDALEWKGKYNFNLAEEKPFLARDVVHPPAELTNAGVARAFENLALVRVFNAGHMVPTHQPAASLDLINRFFKNEALA